MVRRKRILIRLDAPNNSPFSMCIPLCKDEEGEELSRISQRSGEVTLVSPCTALTIILQGSS